MKSVTAMTEQEILELTDDDVRNMVNIRKAQEGIKLLEKPTPPILDQIDKPSTEVFCCGLLGDKLVFENREDLESVLSVFKGGVEANEITYDWNESTQVYRLKPIKHDYHFDSLFQIKNKSVYSFSKYEEIKDTIKSNATLSSRYESDLKEYEKAIDESMWVEEEIWGAVNKVRDKYWNMNRLMDLFARDYMPLSENKESVAMGFLKKAYDVNEDTVEYILENYKTEQ